MPEVYDGENGFHRVHLHLNDQLSLEHFGFFRVPADWPGVEQTHGYWELHYFRRGRGRLCYDRRELPYEAGGIYLVPPFVRHRLINEEPGECIYAGFNFHLSAARRAEWVRRCPVVSTIPAVAALAPGLDAVVAEVAASDRHLDAGRRRLWGVLPSLLLALTRAEDEAADARRERVVQLCNRIKQHLAEHAERPIAVGEVARHFHLSPHYLGNLFRSVTGATVKEYHNALRMARAAELLRDPALTVTEVADRLGYSTVHYFSKQFAAYFRLPPSRWR
jgi:AraC-like DNA-binding protein/mannose-6-phosphate isomerase-like protein (cupin superfamily)